MKRIQFLIAFATFLSTASFSQVVKKGAYEIATIKTPTVQCEQCKEKIENYLKREDGVTKVVVDYKKKTTKVTYLVDRTNYENIKTAIANCGYDADDVAADKDAYQNLPKCCKKPVDGGGMGKQQ
ncbi:MAG: cation transporter [Bacteroidetes bacterium]|nr:cation transporter [Bacteroidota bacterium]